MNKFKIRQLSMRARMIVTFSVFIAAITLGITILILSGETTVDELKNTVTNQPATVFYKTIGQAPDLSTLSQGTKAVLQNTYTLEIKVANSRGEAEKIIDQLQRQGIKAYFTPLNRGGQIVYRVRYGIYKTQSAADKASIGLRASKQISNRVSKL